MFGIRPRINVSGRRKEAHSPSGIYALAERAATRVTRCELTNEEVVVFSFLSPDGHARQMAFLCRTRTPLHAACVTADAVAQQRIQLPLIPPPPPPTALKDMASMPAGACGLPATLK